MVFRLTILAGTLVIAFSVTGCSDNDSSSGKAESTTPETSATAGDQLNAASAGSKVSTVLPRWYKPEQVERGAEVYAQNCASCHGNDAQGNFAWRKRDAQGNLPPPPLNGSGHAWHHPIRVLGSQIKFGAPGGLGTMPGFDQALTDEQIADAIAWFQSKWSDENYAAWFDIESRSNSGKN